MGILLFNYLSKKWTEFLKTKSFSGSFYTSLGVRKRYVNRLFSELFFKLHFLLVFWVTCKTFFLSTY